jgi:hypothetical protein
MRPCMGMHICINVRSFAVRKTHMEHVPHLIGAMLHVRNFFTDYLHILDFFITASFTTIGVD